MKFRFYTEFEQSFLDIHIIFILYYTLINPNTFTAAHINFTIHETFKIILKLLVPSLTKHNILINR